jgi:hypothetical protein
MSSHGINFEVYSEQPSLPHGSLQSETEMGMGLDKQEPPIGVTGWLEGWCMECHRWIEYCICHRRT